MMPDKDWFTVWETAAVRLIPQPFLFIPEFNVSVLNTCI